MAMKLGEIFVSLGLSTASFTTDLKKCKDLAFGSAKEMERSFKIMGTALVASLAAGGTALALLTKQAIDNADHMGKLAQTTGMSVEQFSALAYAAKRSDIDVSMFAQSLIMLAKNLEKANQQTLEGKAAHSALSTLFRGNIPVFKDTNDAFQQIAARLSLLPDGFQKTALAAQIMGRYGGAALIPMLGTLAEMTARAQKLGVVISTETAAKAAEFNEGLKDLHIQVSAFALGIASELLPKLTELTKAFADVGAVDAGKALGRQIDSVWNTVQRFGVAMQIATAQQALWWQGLLHIGDSAGTQARLNELRNAMNDLRLEQARLLGDIPPLAAATDDHARALKDLQEKLLAAHEKVVKFTQALRDQIFEHTHNVIAVNAYKAAQLGANDADQAAIAILSRQLFFLDLKKKALEHPTLPAVPITMENLPSLAKERLQPPAELTDFSNWQASYMEAAQKTGDALFAMVDRPRVPLSEFQVGLRSLRSTMLSLNSPAYELGREMGQFAERSLQAFGDWLIVGGSFRQMLQGIVQDLARIFFKLTVIDPLMKSLFGGGGGGGGLFSSIFGSILGGLFGGAVPGVSDPGFGIPIPAIAGMASGGQFSGGGPFLVGERGPELFLPGSSGGTIVPNGGFGGGGGVTIVNNIDNRGADLGTTAKTAALVNKMGIEQYHRMVLDRQARTA